MRFVCDEGVDRQIVDRLRLEGHDVTYIAEVAPQSSDDTILADARQRDAVLITADRDFGDLIFLQRLLPTGVVLVRLAGVPPESKAGIVAAIVREHAAELPGGFTVVSPGQVRRRPLPSR